MFSRIDSGFKSIISRSPHQIALPTSSKTSIELSLIQLSSDWADEAFVTSLLSVVSISVSLSGLEVFLFLKLGCVMAFSGVGMYYISLFPHSHSSRAFSA